MIRLAVQRPVATLMGCLIVVLLGVVALRGLAVDLMPEVSFPTVSVITLYPGTAPEEMETLVTRPLEQALSAVSRVERLSSTSAEGSSTIRVQLQWGTDLDAAIADMRQTIDKIREQLPEGIEEPYIRQFDVADRPIIYLGLISNLDPLSLTRLAEKQIVPRLERIEGVARVGLRGAVRREIQVDINRHELEARNIAVSEVVAALERENRVQRAGDLQEGHFNVLVRSRGEFGNLQQIADTVIRQRAGVVVRVRDIARVVDGLERRTELTRTDGRPGMMVYVFKQSGANTIAVSDAVHSAVAELNAQLPEADLTIRIDKSDFIRQAIANVRGSAVLGMVLAVGVLLFFLRSFRSTLVIAISMPLSLLATFVLIYFKGFTLNLISFGGLALGIGLLVDNSIVVLESIFRLRAEGVDARSAAVQGTREVAAAITASTLTTLIVFLPLLFIEGVTGILLHQLAWVVSMALVCSLLFSLTLTPVLTTFWDEPTAERQGWLRRAAGRLHACNGALVRAGETGYRKVLQLSMRHAGLVGCLLLLAFSSTLGLVPLIGTEFIPRTDEGDLRVEAEMAAGVQLATLDRQSRQVEELVRRHVPEALVMSSFVGDEARDGDRWHHANIRLRLRPRSQRQRSLEEIRSDLEQRMEPIAGMKVRVRASNDTLMFRMVNQDGGGDVEVEIRGHDQETAERLAVEVAERMAATRGLTNINPGTQDRRPVMSAEIDRAKASLLGISVGDITQALETTIRGTEATVYHDQGDEFNVVVRLTEQDRSRQADLGYVTTATPTGRLVPLRNLVRFRHHQDAVAIQRLDQQRTVTVAADVSQRDLGSVVADLRDKLDTLPLPTGFTLNIAGDWEEQQRSFNALRIGFLLAVMLMYMVMAAQFESLRDPLLILLTLPLAAVGVILILVLTESTLNVQSFIGLIMLAGIVVNNAIVLIDYMNQLRAGQPELPLEEVILLAAVRRFRPIMMTTTTTVLAMIPIALGWGEGGELQAPLARVVIGGLLSGTLITLLAIPLAYRFEKGRLERAPKQRTESPAGSGTMKGEMVAESGRLEVGAERLAGDDAGISSDECRPLARLESGPISS
ncbi:MAG: efflux RND transporter permease subunit [Pirellulaceae bacterium]|nr:efflux RND transporter permease subunit [Pirellulaceae bacterium]